jgi:hypothetical protein
LTVKRGGKAEDQVPICPGCHGAGHDQGWRALEERAGIELRALAAELAAAGHAQGYLPVERCAECGAWHSKRLMVDSKDIASGEVRRLCEECAPPGPP